MTERVSKDSHVVKNKSSSKSSVSETPVKDVYAKAVHSGSKKMLEKVFKDILQTVVKKLKKL